MSGMIYRLLWIISAAPDWLDGVASLCYSTVWETINSRMKEIIIKNKIMFLRTRSLCNAMTFFERAYLAPKHTEVTINTSMSSSVMWPFDTPCAISYRCSVVITEAVSPVVFEIMGPEHFGVTTLTFQGHVTSSIRWYRSTEKSFANCNLSCACALNLVNFGPQTTTNRTGVSTDQRAGVAWVTFRRSYVVAKFPRVKVTPYIVIARELPLT